MKTNNIIIAAFMLVLSAAVDNAAAAVVPNAGKETAADYTVNVKGVDRIENRSALTVYYKQGTQSSMRVVEKGKYGSQVRVRGNAVVVDMPNGTNGYNTVVIGGSGAVVKTEIYITLPRLAEVYNNSSLTLDMGALKGAGFAMTVKNSGSMSMKMSTVNTSSGNLNVNNYGSLRLSANSMSMETIDLYNSGSFNVEVPSVATSGNLVIKNSGVLSLVTPQVKASKFEMNNYGSLNISGDMAVSCGEFSLYNSGSQNKGATIKVSAATASVKNSGALKDNIDMRGDVNNSSLEVFDYGVMNNSVKFTGGKAEFYSSGASNISADVNCATLSVKKYSGSGVIKCSGKAGTLSMSGTDSKTINVEKLQTGKVAERYFTGDSYGLRVYGNGTVERVKKNDNGGAVNQYNP